jgi:hypothetical protein
MLKHLSLCAVALILVFPCGCNKFHSTAPIASCPRTMTPTLTTTPSVPPTATWTEARVDTPTPTATPSATHTPAVTPTYTPTETAVPPLSTWTPDVPYGGCISVTVRGLDNCSDPAHSEEQMSVKVQVVPGRTYRLRLTDGCIGYGYYLGTPLYGTRLRIYNPAVGNPISSTNRANIGWGSFLQASNGGIGLGNHTLFADCEGAKAMGYQPPYNPLVLTANGNLLYLMADDQGCGVCGDNWGEQVVEICEDGVPGPAGTPTVTWTPYPFSSTYTPIVTPTPTFTPSPH